MVGSPDGLTIVDYKTKVNTTPYMLSKTMAEYEFSHQMYFYAIALRALGYHIEAFTIAMCVIEPKPKRHIWTYMIDERVIGEYEHAFRLLADRMRVVQQGVASTLALAHSDQYGECPWKAYCLLDYTTDTIPRKRQEISLPVAQD